jgi:tetratricopeptide (TPR) repeat protein
MIKMGESVQGSFSMHPVVHRWASHIQDVAGKMEFLRLAVMVIGSSVPMNTSKDYWVLQRRLLPHAKRCPRWMGEIYELGWGFNDLLTISAPLGLGRLYINQGRLKEAETMLRHALEGSKKVLGRDHMLTLSTVNNLGLLFVDQGRLKEAETMLRQALKGFEKALGPDHTWTLDTVTNLGRLYNQQGKLQEAEAMYRRALLGFQSALGPSHSKCQPLMR